MRPSSSGSAAFGPVARSACKLRRVPRVLARYRGRGVELLESTTESSAAARVEQVRHDRRDRAARRCVSSRRSTSRVARRHRVAIRSLLIAQTIGRDTRSVREPDPSPRFTAPDELRNGSGACPAASLPQTAAAFSRRVRNEPVVAATNSRYAHSVDRSSTSRMTAARSMNTSHVGRVRPRPNCVELEGVVIDTAAIMLVAAVDYANRVRCEARGRSCTVSRRCRARPGSRRSDLLNAA